VLRRCLAFVAVMLLAACIGGDDGGEDPGDIVPGEPSAGGVLRLGIGGSLLVDPAEASLASPSDLMVLDLLHDGLTRVDAAGVPQPELATDWEANDEATAFRFHLDPEATFSSGRAITPDDVIASLERVMKAGDTSLTALSLEAVEGFRAFVDGEAEHVGGLTAPDARTVRVGLFTPLSVLPSVLSSPMLSVIDTNTIEGEREAVDLSGGWSVASAGDDLIALERREGDSGSLGSIELRPHDSAEDAYEAFEDGEVDWAEVPASRYGDALEEYGDDAFASFHAELFFGMNVNSQSLGSTSMRQAIQLAIDREAIVEAVYPDLAEPLATVVPAGVVGHDPERCPECGSDPAKAAGIVAFAFPDGAPEVRIDYDESPAQDQMARMIAEQLDAVGIPTRLHPLPLDEYKAFVVSGRQLLFSFGWIGSYSSPDAYLAPLFGSAANDNLTSYRSSQVDGLLDRARAGSDAAKNAERWALAEREILEAAVVVPIAQFRTQVVVASRVEGLEHAVDGSVDWDQVSLTT
jgi:ABC-type transport system substrate-binding protein